MRAHGGKGESGGGGRLYVCVDGERETDRQTETETGTMRQTYLS